jgi:hypothetical protein
MALICYVKTATNKWLLTSESHVNLNRCTPYMRKPDQHTTHFPRSVRVCPSTIRISRGQRIATFHESLTDFDGSHYSWEKGLPTQSIACRLTDSQVRIQFLSQANQWSSRLKTSFYRWHVTRLTEPISPACDQYVQYFLTGANPSVLNRQRRGWQPWRCCLATRTPRPSQPVVSTFHLRAPPDLQFNQELPNTPKLSLSNLGSACGLLTTWPSTVTYIYA